MNRRIILMLILVLTAVGLIESCGGIDEEQQAAQDTTEIAENPAFILADSASESFSSCSYRFRVYMISPYSGTPELTGILTGIMSDEIETPLIRIQMEQDSSPDDGIEAELSMILVSGADSAYAYNPDEDILDKGALEEGGANLLGPAVYAVMIEYFLDTPFADEIASQSVVYEGLDTVGTVTCETYLVTYSTGQKARWSLGLEDHIPRRVERMMTDPDGIEMSRVLEVYDLDISPDTSEVIFTIEPSENTSVSLYSAFLRIGTAAPLWTLTDREGNTVSLEDMRSSIVVLDFWATWCQPCVAVMPAIQSLFDSYPQDQVRVYGVNVWESGDPASFMDENGLTYGLLLEGDDVAENYKVTGIPTLYIIDQEGKIAFVEVGANPGIEEMLFTTVDSLLEAE
ncbi:MAG: TlpA family protein disulfide reductase [Candidatus Aegiribacteria sp.]|nr:TlpA family protein disulfide reductase [Candidatus Aegiribacteria sp.]